MSSPVQNPSSDVRMRGFAHRVAVQAALDWVDGAAQILPGESALMDDVTGRVLAADVTAGIAVPAFDRAAMDGYALRASETTDASDSHPLGFSIAGHAFPAKPFEGNVAPRSAVRIMTGAPVPEGVDVVVPIEHASEINGVVTITRAVAPGHHVGHVGEDIALGATVLAQGRRLRPQDAGLAASLGLTHLPVVRLPRVRLLVTGNEVRPAGEPKRPYEIYDANSMMLRGLVHRDGGAIESLLRLGDDPQRIGEAMSAPGADVVLISGGSSVGTEDHAPRLLSELGELVVHGVAMRPASPAGMGRIGNTLVFLLPGNPVACLCAYDFFAGRAIRLLGGRPVDWPYRQTRAVATHPFVSQLGRVDCVRVKLGPAGVEPLALSGASMLSTTTRADGFVVVPADSEGYGAGTEVSIHLYECP